MSCRTSMIHGDLRLTRALAISAAEAPSITTREWFPRPVDEKDRDLCWLRCVVFALGLPLRMIGMTGKP
jgi:hypothetical protein